MIKQKKPFIVEIKNSRRTKSRQVEPARSIWGKLAVDLKQTLAKEQDAPAGSSAPEDCPERPGPGPAAVEDNNEAEVLPRRPQFPEKWIAKKAERPKAGSQDAVAAFLARIDQQKQLLAELRSDPAGFRRWRSAWFRKVAGGFGVSVSHDSIDAGGGLRYVVVDTVDDVSQFLDDLYRHAQTDLDFRQALEENRAHRAARLAGTKAV